jgi:V-type H+-transporting ATPase subunit a
MNPAYDTPYPFGVDPVWHGTKTELQFTNSMKMKMSVIMGVVQMTCGIFLSALNHRQSKDRLSMMYEFIPQV